ncbi:MULTISPECIES: helix-turn-helix domain-containing protein [Amycolatopsis]|uniref:helix-turn-helix domain-containing protein n=1 Tax=Amycolatopsis TaxID=1813 RepID=UPI000B8AC3CE|nr:MULTISPECIES: PucR family transcriptional regulator [Amycolatopsis]OXM75075.1 PucR family transcriptional regulator [Amycolatopsis sp. KNN50.9b]
MLVEDLLSDSALALDVRVSGRVRRPIRWVHTIEVADPGRFLRGGEVVLTAGVWRASGVPAERFVADLAAADVAAVGFGLVTAGDEVPPEFVAAAAEHGLTCFVVPVAVPFVQIVETFVSVKRAEWERPLRRHLDQHDAIVAALRHRRGVATVLRILVSQLGLPVALRSGGTVTGEVPEPPHPLPLIGEGLADAEILLPRPLPDLDVDAQAAVVRAMPFLALELERERAVRATELRYAWELFEWIQGGTTSAATLATRLRSLGVGTDRPIAALVLRTDPDSGAADRLRRLLDPGSVVVERGPEVLALTPAPRSMAELAGSLHAGLRRAGVHGHLGAGSPGGAAELRLSLLQARHAAEAAAARESSGWLTYEQLHSPTLLLAAQDPDLLAATAKAVLGPILEHDERRGGDLLPSLAVFLDSGGRWQESAQALHVHINTLRHRMRRVEELTGRSLASTQDRVDLFLALRALNLP